jgi:hypothetical protein
MEKKLVIPTEVYSRVVGYYRPVQHWNKGKVQEFADRKTFKNAEALNGKEEKGQGNQLS